jgi:hypothetical protein
MATKKYVRTLPTAQQAASINLSGPGALTGSKHRLERCMLLRPFLVGSRIGGR